MLWEKLSLFNMKVIIPEALLSFQEKVINSLHRHYFERVRGRETLRRLNRVWVSMQLLFMSDVLMAYGNRISLEILSCRTHGEAWLNMRWPIKQPMTSNIDLWKNAMLSICPSQCLITGVGWHQVWRWHWNNDMSTLHCINDNGITEDVFVIPVLLQLTPWIPQHGVLGAAHTGGVTLASPLHSTNSWRLISSCK